MLREWHSHHFKQTNVSNCGISDPTLSLSPSSLVALGTQLEEAKQLFLGGLTHPSLSQSASFQGWLPGSSVIDLGDLTVASFSHTASHHTPQPIPSSLS